MASKPDRKAFPMEFLIPILILGGWILLSAVILPRLGVPT